MADILWPTVYTALLAKIRSTVGHPGTVQVFDGPPITSEDLRVYVVVGADPASGSAGFWSDTVTTLGLPARHEERGEITGSVASQTGDDDQSSTRSAAFTLLESIVDGIETDPTIGLSSLVEGRIGSGRIDVGQARLGTFTEIAFTYTYLGVTGT